MALAAAGPAQPAPLPIARPHQTSDRREASCLELVRSAPERAVESATDWRAKGGGIAASLCQGLAYTALERWPEAATAFETAAQAAERSGDRRRADMWVEAG